MAHNTLSAIQAQSPNSGAQKVATKGLVPNLSANGELATNMPYSYIPSLNDPGKPSNIQRNLANRVAADMKTPYGRNEEEEEESIRDEAQASEDERRTERTAGQGKTDQQAAANKARQPG